MRIVYKKFRVNLSNIYSYWKSNDCGPSIVFNDGTDDCVTVRFDSDEIRDKYLLEIDNLVGAKSFSI